MATSMSARSAREAERARSIASSQAPVVFHTTLQQSSRRLDRVALRCIGLAQELRHNVRGTSCKFPVSMRMYAAPRDGFTLLSMSEAPGASERLNAPRSRWCLLLPDYRRVASGHFARRGSGDAFLLVQPPEPQFWRRSAFTPSEPTDNRRPIPRLEVAAYRASSANPRSLQIPNAAGIGGTQRPIQCGSSTSIALNTNRCSKQALTVI